MYSMILTRDAFDLFIHLVAYVALFPNNRVPLLMGTSVLFTMHFCLLHCCRICYLKVEFKLESSVFNFHMLIIYRLYSFIKTLSEFVELKQWFSTCGYWPPPLGFEWPFHRGCLILPENADFYIMIDISSKFTVVKKQQK